VLAQRGWTGLRERLASWHARCTDTVQMSGRGSEVGKGRSRRDRLLGDESADPYRESRKPSEPAACPDCNAVFRDGRWQWRTPVFGAAEHLCPACRRSRDAYPAGEISLSGPFLAEHRDEILALARNVEEKEKQNHPLERIMAVDEQADPVRITTTGMHVARAIGAAIEHAYRGELTFHYEKGGDLLRMRWSR
jgi:NMD protein affecting ribosome stability and mRNA decay